MKFKIIGSIIILGIIVLALMLRGGNNNAENPDGSGDNQTPTTDTSNQ